MSVIGSNSILAGASGQGGYFLEDSLRFRSSASAYLSRTPTSTGNRKTWTWSGWVKRSALVSGNLSGAFFSWKTGAAFGYIAFYQDGFRLYDSNAGYLYQTTAKYRDVSAWYHIVVRVDTTEATASNRVRLYINGVEVTSFTTETNPAQNADTNCNTTILHTIGLEQNDSLYFDGYLTEVNFIDGQALDPSYFGEIDTVTGGWKPIKYTGSYGTNGFYLPMTPTSQAEGFNTVLYTGTGATQSITDVGFSPDLVWIKKRSAAEWHALINVLSGTGKFLRSDGTDAEITNRPNCLTSFNSDGFTIGNEAVTNQSGQTFVAWCWDAGSGSPASNTDGTITSTVKANQAKGFSIVTYAGTGAAATVGHGLGTAPSLIICKNRNVLSHWDTYHASLGSAYRIQLSNTIAKEGPSTVYWNSTNPTSSVFSVGYGLHTNGSGNNMVAYCFAEVAGYSKIGSYTGTGASGNSITTGFKPAWLLIKRTDSADKWTIRDCVRSPFNPVKQTLNPNDTSAEYTPSGEDYDFDSNGFTLNNSNGAYNASGGTYIYMAIADTRDTAFNNDASGNQNNWTPNNINSNASGQSTYDLMKDVPTLTDADAGNFATLNAVQKAYGSVTYSNGNLQGVADANWNAMLSTINVTSGKWYWECTTTTTNTFFGVQSQPQSYNTANPQNFSGTIVYYASNGAKRIDGTETSYGASYTSGDTIGVALDIDGGTITFYKNNSSQGSISLSSSSNMVGKTIAPVFMGYSNTIVANFGQSPFAYTPPTGYKALNTYNLPDPTIADGSLYFDNLLYTGNGSASKRTDIAWNNIQPDFVWVKNRSSATDHALHDDVRGVTSRLRSNTPAAESGPSGFGSDGFGYNGVENEFRIFTADSSYNANGSAYVAWGWKASGAAGSSNTDGSITSTVSANTSSGFSVVTWTGNGTNGATVGHGLNTTPKMIIIKNRDNGSGQWLVQHSGLSGQPKASSTTFELAGSNTNGMLLLNGTGAVITYSFDAQINGNGQDLVAYCFAPIEGYSAFGSYVGNGNSDGTFVYLGFRPAVVISKKSSGIGDWQIQTADIPGYNVVTKTLFPNYSIAEATNPNLLVDFVSNGFKWRATSGNTNGNGDTFIYAAFAENPFKFSLAR